MIDSTGFRYDYLSLFKREHLWLRDRVQALEPIEGLPTMVASYDAEIRVAMDNIRSHFDNQPSDRPLNCLLLGPPGAGKSFLAGKLAAATSVAGENFITINCAHHGSRDELGAQLRLVSANPDDKKIVLIDECDVSLAGSSAMRYLIDPMYEGKDFQGSKFKNTVFLFCGSYLRNREIKQQIEDKASSLSVPKLLHDLLLESHGDDREVLRDGFLASCMLSEFRERTAPTGNMVRYLRRLEKLNDFLSRINGPIIEIPDVSRPLEMSSPHFLISSGRVPGDPKQDDIKFEGPEIQALQSVRIGKSCPAERLLRFVADSELPRLPAGRKHQSGSAERFRFAFRHPWDAFLAFKNMMIVERLLRVCDMIRKTKLGADKHFEIRADELNYLALVPVVHGMRSVETIITRLLHLDKKGDSNRVSVRPDHFDMIVKSQIEDDRSYSSACVVWDLVVQNNRRALSNGTNQAIPGNQIMEVLL